MQKWLDRAHARPGGSCSLHSMFKVGANSPDLGTRRSCQVLILAPKRQPTFVDPIMVQLSHTSCSLSLAYHAHYQPTALDSNSRLCSPETRLTSLLIVQAMQMTSSTIPLANLQRAPPDADAIFIDTTRRQHVLPLSLIRSSSKQLFLSSRSCSSRFRTTILPACPCSPQSKYSSLQRSEALRLPLIRHPRPMSR